MLFHFRLGLIEGGIRNKIFGIMQHYIKHFGRIRVRFFFESSLRIEIHCKIKRMLSPGYQLRGVTGIKCVVDR